jgi:hypothetical protein
MPRSTENRIVRTEVARGDSYPDYTPDQAGSVVDFVRGRWLAGWCRLEEAHSTVEIACRLARLPIALS